jgi:iron complex outermembrane receptor protein
MPPLQGTTTLRFSKKNFSAQLENESAAKQNRVNADWGEDTTAAYSIFNLRGNYRFALSKNKLNLSAAVENMFDKNYHNHLDWGNIPRQGRNLNISLILNF